MLRSLVGSEMCIRDRVRLADRIHNMRTLQYHPKEKRIYIARETMDIYAPLANRLGINSMRMELEDLAFQYIAPDAYNDLTAKIVKSNEARNRYTEEVKNIIQQEMEKYSVACKVEGRDKHLYSIYKKMHEQHINIDDVYDLIAFRIILYAAKANGNLNIIKILAQEGAGADVFSSGELHMALLAGMKPEHLLFNGSSKTEADHRLAVEKGVRVSLDSLDELAQLDRIAGEAGKVVEVSFRVNPAIDVPTHPKIATGLATSKFGIPAAEITDEYAAALACTNVVPVGIHCHIGSQIRDVEPFAKEAQVMMEVVE